MAITQTYSLDLVPNGPDVVVKVSQYDKLSRTITFNMYEESQPFTVPSGATVTVRGTKRDNTGFEYPCTSSGTTISFDIQEQMTIFNGKVLCEIRITNGGEILGTANFILFVERTTLEDGIVISETDIPLVEKAAQVADELDSIIEAIDKVSAIVPDGDGTAGQFLQKTNSGTTWSDVNSAVWGNITGTLSNQTDLSNALDSKVSKVNNISPVNGNVTLNSSDVPFDITSSFMTTTNVQSTLEYLSKHIYLDVGYKSGVTSIPNNTATTLGYVEAPANGTYMIAVMAGYASNGTGNRVITCNVNTTTYSPALGVTVPAVSGVKTSIAFTRIVGANANQKVYVIAQQNSGSALNLEWQYSLLLCERKD